jgi:hypothetical protein
MQDGKKKSINLLSLMGAIPTVIVTAIAVWTAATPVIAEDRGLTDAV